MIEPARFAAVLDEIESALDKTKRATPASEGLSPFGWADAVPTSERTVKVQPRPISPIRATDPADVLIGVLQRLVWHECESHTSGARSGSKLFYILLAMADKLSKRKLRLTSDQAVDLSKFCIFPGPGKHKFGRTDYMSAILKQLERECARDVPPKLRKQLLALAKQINAYKADLIASYRAWGGVPGTKSLDKARDRVLALARR